VVGFGGGNVSGALALATNPLVWLGLAAMPALAFVVYRTTFGLRVRAVVNIRSRSLARRPGQPGALRGRAGSGALAASAGPTWPSTSTVHRLDDSGPRLHCPGRRDLRALGPVRAGLACLLFAGAETLQIRLQAAQLIPSQFVAMIPYVLTIVAVAASSAGARRRQRSAEPPMRERCGRVCPAAARVEMHAAP